MKSYVCLLLVLLAVTSAIAEDTSTAEIPVPIAAEANGELVEAAETKTFDRDELMTYPKAVLVNLCLGLQSRVTELEALTRGDIDVPALQNRVAELEAEIATLKQSIAALPPVPDWRGSSTGLDGVDESSVAEDKPDDKADNGGITYKYIIQYRSHYQYGGTYETRTRSARHLRNRIRVLLRLTNTSDTTKHVTYYIEACTNKGGFKVVQRTGRITATLKPGEFQEPSFEMLGDDIAIATDLIRLSDVEITEVEPR